jgi:outer membrane protein
MNRFFLTGLLVSLLTLTLPAQEAEIWTLERCINYALENNLEIKRQELQTILTEKDYKQDKYNLMPSLGAGIEHQLSSGRSLNIETYEWENRKIQQGSAGVRSDLTLFGGLQNYNSIQQGKFLFLSSQADLETLINDKTLTLAAYYLDILFSEELLEVAQSQYETTLLQVERNKKMVEVGNAARAELLEIQAQAASEKLKVTEADNTLNLAILDLTQLLDLDSVGNFQIYKPDLDVELIESPLSVTEIYSTAVTNMPEIKSAEYSLLAQEKAVAIAKGSRWPELYLSGLYYSRYLKDATNPVSPEEAYALNNQLKDNQYAQLTIGLSIPIFSKLQTQTNISKSKVLLKDYNYMLDQQKQVLYKKIQQYHADAVAAHEKYVSALEAVLSNEEAFNYTQQKFEVGLVNSVDFNIAKNNLAKARSDLAQAKYEYIFKIKILDFYQGKPIQL